MFQKKLWSVELKKIWNNKEIITDHYLLSYKDLNSIFFFHKLRKNNNVDNKNYFVSK